MNSKELIATLDSIQKPDAELIFIDEDILPNWLQYDVTNNTIYAAEPEIVEIPVVKTDAEGNVLEDQGVEDTDADADIFEEDSAEDQAEEAVEEIKPFKFNG